MVGVDSRALSDWYYIDVLYHTDVVQNVNDVNNMQLNYEII